MTLLKILLAFSIILFIPMIDGTQLGFARFFGYMSLLLVWWQVMLGNRFTNNLFTRDLLRINTLHRFLGTYGFFLLVTHYVLIVLVYGLSTLINSEFTGFDLGVKYGMLAFYVAAGIWITSALLRSRLSWDWWKRLHLAAYVIFPLGILHSWSVGSSHEVLNSVQFARYFMLISFGLMVIARVMDWAGLLKKRYVVHSIEPVANGVKRITLKPRTGARIAPQPGQFTYFQYKRFDQAHPFTVSDFDSDTGKISLSIKASGDWTQRLHQELTEGDHVFIDGPYGVYTQNISPTDDNIIIIAGGIGITPFLRLMKSGIIKHLFYGNRTVSDIAYKDYIESNVAETIHVLSEQETEDSESGYISTELLKRNLPNELTYYKFYICGPPIMMSKLTESLHQEGVTDSQIHTEKFSL